MAGRVGISYRYKKTKQKPIIGRLLFARLEQKNSMQLAWLWLIYPAWNLLWKFVWALIRNKGVKGIVSTYDNGINNNEENTRNGLLLAQCQQVARRLRAIVIVVFSDQEKPVSHDLGYKRSQKF